MDTSERQVSSMKLKRRILNITFISLVILTFMFLFAEFIQLEKESQQYHGSELIGMAAAYGALLIIFTIFFFSELSIYFNFRYFLLCKSKTILKTVLNIVALVMNIGLLAFLPAFFDYSFITEHMQKMYLLCFAVFILLRIITCFIPNGRATSGDS